MKLGIIGGSGLYALEGLTDVTERVMDTPFGAPSDAYICGRMEGREVIFLPRHGRGHRLLPSELNHRANIFGFKLLGVDCVLSISAVGSLREDFKPCDVVLPDQYFDRTKRWEDHTFFGRGIVAHVAFGDPTCAALRAAVATVCRRVAQREAPGSRIHDGGTYVNMEGPAFSTKAESHFYRRMGFDVIGMTSLAEAKLCREAELCYQAAAMVTDYDCWHESAAAVTVEMVIANLTANTRFAKGIVRELIVNLPEIRSCGCDHALQNSIMTTADAIPARIKAELAPLIGKYIR